MEGDAVDDVALVRRRAGMYVGGAGGEGVLALVQEVVGNAFDQHLAGRCATIDIVIEGDGSITVTDDGPGYPARGDAARPPMHALLTTRSTQPTVDGHRPHVHLGIGGNGLFIVNAMSARFEVVTVHAGIEARGVYEHGRVVDPVTTTVTTRPSGTTVRFRPDPEIFRTLRVPRAELTSQLEALTFLAPTMTLRWRFDGDDEARAGLAAWVASMAERPIAEVAHHRCTHGDGVEAIDIDVALAWEPSGYVGTAPRIDSYVNYRRSISGGSHVDGLIDGVCGFVGVAHRQACARKLVAVVAVVLADVTWGNPTRDRLVTEAVRAPVAAATRAALDAWAAAWPAHADELRARGAHARR